MWITGLLKSFFGGLQALFSWLTQNQLIDAGRREVELEANKQALRNMEVANEIDDQPLPPHIVDFLHSK